ncbi:hypothetical protein QAD02_002558 [Eretmocerus hayati]|uniref:Uncharacterized protein n=1 Tax=Eretmocerus hayati TaxID=131215 RepID=A0ACC2NLX4_9HYME|nr:hypothetical protein QAD02_002558 [Eretmocerus hayati]
MNSQQLRKLIVVLAIRESRRSPWKRSKAAKIARLLLLLRLLLQREENLKRVWVTEVYTVQERLAHGASENFIETVRRTDAERFYNFLRMTPPVFDLLLSIVGPEITKQRAVREPISAKCRLEITIRYLATGDNYETLSALFRVSPQSISVIVNQVTAVIWACLKPLVFQDPDGEFWLERIEEMSWEWDMEHCIGAIDDKLVTIQALPHSGSMMYDYKGHHSVHLQAIFDAYQRFILY